MNDDKYFQELKSLIENSPHGYSKTLRAKKYEYLRNWIIEKTPLLDVKKHTLRTRIYWILNGLTDFPLCEYDGKKIIDANVATITLGYITHYCCKKCQYAAMLDKSKQTCLKKYGVEFSFQSENNKIKSKQTCLKKYGVENCSGAASVQEQRRQTCLKRYGVDSFSKTQEFKNKTEQTCLSRYGVKHYQSTEECKEKKKKTCLERYGVEYAAQSEQAKQQYKQTCLEKYGVDSFSKTQEFKDKTAQTCLARYGVTNVWNSEADGREKGKQTCLERYGDATYNNREKAATTCVERYGVTNPAEVSAFSKQMSTTKKYNTYANLLSNKYVIPLFSFDEYCNKTPDTVFKWKCLECGNEFEYKIDWNNRVRPWYADSDIPVLARCEKCHPFRMSGSSYEERDFIAEIKKLYSGEIAERTAMLETGKDRRNWLEIDCYLPELKLGFEYDGLYFHQMTENCKENKHFLKTMLAEQQGIRLMHVRSDVWFSDRQKILSVISALVKQQDFSISGFYDDAPTIEVDRYLFNKQFEVPGYSYIGETEPTIDEIGINSRIIECWNCGKLIYKKVK